MLGLYSMRAGKDLVLFRVANTVYNWGLTPNMLTAIGLTLGVGSGVLFAVKALPFAFTLGFLSVFCDVLDGTLARKFHLESKTGLIFDSVADRVTESAVVVGALMGGVIQPLGLVAIVSSVTLLALRTVSYRRGLRTDYVLFGRFERLAFILVGLFLPVVFLSTVCFVIAGGFGLVSSIQIGISLMHKNRFQNRSLLKGVSAGAD